MLPGSNPSKRIHPDCPDELRRFVDVMLATRLARQTVNPGETLDDLARRHCPELDEQLAGHGFVVRFDMPENTHRALLKGRLFYQIRRKPVH